MKLALQQPYKQFFGTLANQVRLDIIKQLADKSLCVGEIAEKTKYTQSTISHSLKRLEECGFVNVTRDGKNRIYTLNQDTIKPLFTLMEGHMNNYCCHVVARKEAKK